MSKDRWSKVKIYQKPKRISAKESGLSVQKLFSVEKSENWQLRGTNCDGKLAFCSVKCHLKVLLRGEIIIPFVYGGKEITFRGRK